MFSLREVRLLLAKVFLPPAEIVFVMSKLSLPLRELSFVPHELGFPLVSLGFPMAKQCHAPAQSTSKACFLAPLRKVVAVPDR